MDTFSKMVHLVPLSKQPSAMETTNQLVTHLIQPHRLPIDVLDFCKAIRVLASLSTGFHPQTNGQVNQTGSGARSPLYLPAILPPGPLICLGCNMLATPSLLLLRVDHPSWLPMVTSHCCSPPKKEVLQCMTIYAVSIEWRHAKKPCTSCHNSL